MFESWYTNKLYDYVYRYSNTDLRTCPCDADLHCDRVLYRRVQRKMEENEMKIPFDIKYRPQIESGEYRVVTRKGETVRIERWDGKDDANPIDAFIWHNDEWNGPWHWHSNGLYKTAKSEDGFDLFIITPEPELTEFEEMLYSIFDAYNGLKIDVKAAVDVNAKTLLELAKKEICKECTVGLDQYWKGYEEAMKAKKHDTFSCPTYEPPCYHGGVCTNPMKGCINCPRTGGDIGISTTSGTCKKD